MEEKIWNRDFAISICDQATLYVVKIELDQKIGGQCVSRMSSIESKGQKPRIWRAQSPLEKQKNKTMNINVPRAQNKEKFQERHLDIPK